MVVVLCALFSSSALRGAFGHDGDISHSRPSSVDLSFVNSSFAAFNCHNGDDDACRNGA